MIPLCRSLLPDNPSWQGWVTEMEVLSIMRQQSQLLLWHKDGLQEVWETLSKRTITDENDTSIGPLISKGTWLIPSKYNQGCFDAFYLTHNGTLRVVQITNAISLIINWVYWSLL